MFNRLPRHLALLTTLALAVSCTFVTERSDGAGAPPAVGEKAAEFSLNTLDGKTVTLSDLNKKGPVVLLVLRGWVTYQCPLCTKQVADFLAHAKELQSAGAQVVLLYPGPDDQLKEHAEEFIKGKGLPDNFSFVIDPDLKFVNSWNLRWNAPKETAYPSTFVIDRDGKIVFSKTSKSHGDRAAAADVLKVLTTKAP